MSSIIMLRVKRKFHVVMHVAKLLFVNINILFFAVLLAVAVAVAFVVIQ